MAFESCEAAFTTWLPKEVNVAGNFGQVLRHSYPVLQETAIEVDQFQTALHASEIFWSWQVTNGIGLESLHFNTVRGNGASQKLDASEQLCFRKLSRKICAHEACPTPVSIALRAPASMYCISGF